jgi:stearoyl-CoA desaturase (delta-9 desaturase)
MLFNGLLDLPWWGLMLVALGLTSRSLRNHLPAPEPGAARWTCIRPWRIFPPLAVDDHRHGDQEWTAIHRKHHAKCETGEDPHSPQVHGINKVLWTGVLLYVKESHYPTPWSAMARHGGLGQRNVYANTRCSASGSWAPSTSRRWRDRR